VAAKNEERHLNERQHYSRDGKVETITDSLYSKQERFEHTCTFNVLQGRSGDNQENTSGRNTQYICNSANHLAHQCRASNTESTGKSPVARQVILGKRQ